MVDTASDSEHPDYAKLTSGLYVAVCAFPCDVTSETPCDLRIIGGRVAQHEYECFAIFAETFGHTSAGIQRQETVTEEMRIANKSVQLTL